MKTIFLFLTLFGSIGLANPSTEITSFVYSGPKIRVAEVCGKVVSAATYPVYVEITVDPKSKTPATYYVTTLGEKWCTNVTTWTGKADAKVVD